MIPRVHQRGTRTIGLLYYLYGPGTHEEHIDPHLVAAFDPLTPDPGRDPGATYQQLRRLLDQPVDALPQERRPAKHVWHLSVRAAPEDPILSDEDWASIARRMVAVTGIAPDGDERACRWAAIRHADDHIHIIATLVRDDGRRPRLHNEARRAQAEARLIETDYGLRQVTPGDGTAAKRPTSVERHKAQRLGRKRPAREELREIVRQAVAGATSEAEFFARLQAAGLLVRTRALPSGDLSGYTVALPGDHNQGQRTRLLRGLHPRPRPVPAPRPRPLRHRPGSSAGAARTPGHHPGAQAGIGSGCRPALGHPRHLDGPAHPRPGRRRRRRGPHRGHRRDPRHPRTDQRRPHSPPAP